MALKNFPNDSAIDNAIPPVAAAREDAGEPLRKETNEVLKDIRDATQERFAEVASDDRWTDSREWSAETVTKADAEAGTATERKAWTAQRVWQAITAFFNKATSPFTRALLGRTSAAQVRTDLELGDAATREVGTASGTVAAGNDSRITGALQKADLAATTGQGTSTALTQKAASDKFSAVEGDITALENGLGIAQDDITALEIDVQNKVDKDGAKVLSDENYTSAEKAKLAGLQGSKWKGKFVSLAALQSGVATPEVGDYADADSGIGSDIKRYIYDANDAKWVEQAGVVADLTGAQIKALYESEPDTNAFTDDAQTANALVRTAQAFMKIFLGAANKAAARLAIDAVEEAPANGTLQARKDKAWINIPDPKSALADLTDVDFGTPTDGQVLTYDATTQKSKFADPAGGGGDVEEAPTDGEAYGRKDGAWVVVPSPVDALLDFGYGTDKFLLNSDFPDDTKRYSGLVQLMNAPMRYVATPLISYDGGVVIMGRQIDYSMIAELSLISFSFLVYKDIFGVGSEVYAPILTGATTFATGELTQLNNFTGDFSVTEATFYRNDYIDTGLKYLNLDIPAGLAGQKVSVSVTGAGVGLDFDPNGVSTIPLVPSISTTDLDLMFYAKPLYSGVDSSGFEYKIWFPDSLDTIYLETQNPNQHTLEVYF